MGNKNVTEEDLNNIADSYTNYVFADAYREENDEYQSFLQNLDVLCSTDFLDEPACCIHYQM